MSQQTRVNSLQPFKGEIDPLVKRGSRKGVILFPKVVNLSTSRHERVKGEQADDILLKSLFVLQPIKTLLAADKQTRRIYII